MAVAPEDDELLLEDQVEGGDGDDQQGEEEGQGSDEAGDLADEELEITFGDEAAPASGERDTGLVKHLREEIRRRDQELADFRRTQPKQKIEVGPKPDLWEDCDGDTERYDAALLKWNADKAEAERAETQDQQAAREASEAWQTELRNFEAKRAELKFSDAQDAVEVATSSLTQVQQAVIVKAAANPALVLYSLGKHPAKLAEIASIKDPLKQAAAVAILEGTLKVTTRRKAPDPEEIASGNASVKQGADKTLERLEAEAARNGGDRTKVIAYKARQKAGQK